jgi:hypothetical protein
MLLSEPMIESYYLETPERLLFAVKGFEPPDDLIAWSSLFKPS